MTRLDCQTAPPGRADAAFGPYSPLTRIVGPHRRKSQQSVRSARFGQPEIHRAAGMPLNLGIIRARAAMACEFDEPFILDTGKDEPAC